LWRVKEASLLLYYVCQANPFTHAVELIRFGLYARVEPVSAVVLVAATAIFLTLAVYGYDPAKGLMQRRAAD
jgi:ABC-2 type transport system permease protein